MALRKERQRERKRVIKDYQDTVGLYVDEFLAQGVSIQDISIRMDNNHTAIIASPLGEVRVSFALKDDKLVVTSRPLRPFVH